MAKRTTESALPACRPPTSVEGQENLMTSLAINLAEKQLREGTASSQIIVHYLKLATVEKRLEMEKQRAEILLVEAKAKAIAKSADENDTYARAIEAMRKYQGVEEYYGDEYIAISECPVID